MPERPPTPAERPEGGDDAGPGAGARVLVVDDNALFARATASLLAALGAHVDTAGDGFAALAALAQAPYDLVMLDWEMPRLDGRRAAFEIRRRYGPELPIVVVSAHTGRVRRAIGPEAGIDDVLAKPFDRPELEAILRYWLRRVPPEGAPSAALPESPRPPR